MTLPPPNPELAGAAPKPPAAGAAPKPPVVCAAPPKPVLAAAPNPPAAGAPKPPVHNDNMRKRHGNKVVRVSMLDTFVSLVNAAAVFIVAEWTFVLVGNHLTLDTIASFFVRHNNKIRLQYYLPVPPPPNALPADPNPEFCCC